MEIDDTEWDDCHEYTTLPKELLMKHRLPAANGIQQIGRGVKQEQEKKLAVNDE